MAKGRDLNLRVVFTIGVRIVFAIFRSTSGVLFLFHTDLHIYTICVLWTRFGVHGFEIH